MERKNNLSSLIRETDSSPYPKIVGHFCVEQKYYVVLSLGLCSKSLNQTKITHFTEFAEDPQRTRFEINGHSFIILETEQHFDPHEPRINANHHPTDANELIVLSDRERQIAQLVALGHSNKQIAQQLSISKWTVLTHLRRIFAKLGVDSRAAMVYRCIALIHGNQNTG